MSTEPKIKDKELDKVESSYHTLYAKDVPETEKAHKKGKYSKVPAHKEYRMFIDSFSENKKGLHDIFNKLWDASSKDELELRINSRGGYVNEGEQFYNLITNKFKGRCTTILDNCGFSMGATIFCLGDKRLITERSEIMFHTYTTGLYGKSSEVESQNTHTQEHIKEFFKHSFLDRGFLSKKEFKKMIMGKDYWFGSKEMCKRGIATHVLVGGKQITAKKYLKKNL